MLKSEALVEQVAPTLEKIVASSLRRAPQSEAPLLAWPLACGSVVAARTRALDFASGVLRVEVPDAGWRAELQHLAPRYLAVINRYSRATISRIEFVIGQGQHRS
jgi:Dna[CI] antecedent, DciA